MMDINTRRKLGIHTFTKEIGEIKDFLRDGEKSDKEFDEKFDIGMLEQSLGAFPIDKGSDLAIAMNQRPLQQYIRLLLCLVVAKEVYVRKDSDVIYYYLPEDDEGVLTE